MRSTERVADAAAALGLNITIVTMPDSTRTAEDAAAACNTSVARIVKSLLFARGEGGPPVLILVSGANRVDEALVANRLGVPLARIEARRVRELTGFAIGGVAPIGSLAPLPTFMDADLLQHPTVWAAAGAPNAVFEVDPRLLAERTGAEVIPVR